MSMARGDVGSMFGKSVKSGRGKKEAKGKKMKSQSCPQPPVLLLFAKLYPGFESDTQENRICSLACINIGPCAKCKMNGFNPACIVKQQ